MKNTIIALIWVILFILFGIYIDNRVEDFGIDYIKDVEATYEVIHDDKDFWLKVLDHQYYDDLSLELNLVRNAVYCKNKIRALEELEKIKSILQNLIADEKCNWNYIF